MVDNAGEPCILCGWCFLGRWANDPGGTGRCCRRHLRAGSILNTWPTVPSRSRVLL